MNGHMSKPIVPEELAFTIAKNLKKRTATRRGEPPLLFEQYHDRPEAIA